MNFKFLILLPFFLLGTFVLKAQFSLTGDSVSIDYAIPKEYKIGGITVSGTQHLDDNVLIMLSGLTVGDKIQVPGDKFSKAIENLWKQGLFEDVKISALKIQDNNIFLNIYLVERPRLSKFSFKGVSKSEADDIREKIKLIKGKVLTDFLISSTTTTIKDFFVNKAYINVSVDIKQEPDTSLINSVALIIHIKKGQKIKINDIVFHGNTEFTNKKLWRMMKDTKKKVWYNIFSSSKYLEENFLKDKTKIIEKYNQKGYRDAKIVKDTVYKFSENRVNIELSIDEGKKYFFRNINWVGNSKYGSKELNSILGIKRGDVFDQSVLDAKLFMNPNGNDVSSLYMDDGYLFFQVSPVEILVEKDSIDLEMRIYEGKQAIINKITITGNTKTNDHVIMREIRTKPGQLFRRSDIIRSQRELSQLGYFNAEKLGVNPTPNPADGTVDIDYVVEEKPSDQIELSGGWGGNRVVGTLGVSFNNFSARNMFKGSAWTPLPSGDGQRLSLRAQSNGLYYQSYNASFTEPWLGGKKPNSLSVSLYRTVNTNGVVKTDPTRQTFMITGASVGLGKRLKVPDDYFSLYQEVNFQHYTVNKYPAIALGDGEYNNLNFKFALSRNSVDKPIFETRGSKISLTAQLTPPYSFFNNKNYADLGDQNRFNFIEYQKYKFTASWFTSLTNKRSTDGKESRNLVFNSRFGFGFLGMYNSTVGLSPFERFYLGGSGLTGYQLDGREIIALRGYTDGSLSAATGSPIIGKYTMELRYPISLNPSATIFALAFAEAGNSWATFKNFNPFDVKRSAGLGVRIFLPMFGLLGFDYGWGFDSVDGHPEIGRNPLTNKINNGQFHFTIGAMIGEL